MALTDKLTAVADAIRAKTGKAEEMTLDQMPIEINNIQTKDGSTGASFLGMILETVALRGCEVTVTSEVYYTHFLYNGVRLPRIPDNILKDYPYATIRETTAKGYYDLYVSASGFYFGIYGGRFPVGYDNNGANIANYQIPISADMNTAKWTYKETKYNYFDIQDSGYSLLWSNHDIPNGSATATDIYFEATELVPID